MDDDQTSYFNLKSGIEGTDGADKEELVRRMNELQFGTHRRAAEVRVDPEASFAELAQMMENVTPDGGVKKLVKID